MERNIARTQDGKEYRTNTRWKEAKREHKMERSIERTQVKRSIGIPQEREEYRENTRWRGEYRENRRWKGV